MFRHTTPTPSCGAILKEARGVVPDDAPTMCPGASSSLPTDGGGRRRCYFAEARQNQSPLLQARCLRRERIFREEEEGPGCLYGKGDGRWMGRAAGRSSLGRRAGKPASAPGLRLLRESAGRGLLYGLPLRECVGAGALVLELWAWRFPRRRELIIRLNIVEIMKVCGVCSGRALHGVAGSAHSYFRGKTSSSVVTAGDRSCACCCACCCCSAPLGVPRPLRLVKAGQRLVTIEWPLCEDKEEE